MKSKKIFAAAVLILAVCLLSGQQLTEYVSGEKENGVTLVIDAGHGGMDCGAVAADGTGEKDINLTIAKALKDEAEADGIKVILTRENEDGLYERDNEGGKWSKVGDLRERKRIIKESRADLVISIHLNSFTEDSGVRGAQVFYPGEKSKGIAEKVQAALKEGIDDGTDRAALVKRDMYLFRGLEEKSILVECGFLSNPIDLVNLKSTKHQKKIAECMMNAIGETYKIKIQKKANYIVIDSRTCFQ